MKQYDILVAISAQLFNIFNDIHEIRDKLCSDDDIHCPDHFDIFCSDCQRCIFKDTCMKECLNEE